MQLNAAHSIYIDGFTSFSLTTWDQFVYTASQERWVQSQYIADTVCINDD